MVLVFQGFLYYFRIVDFWLIKQLVTSIFVIKAQILLFVFVLHDSIEVNADHKNNKFTKF